MGTREENVHKALCSEDALGKNGNPMFSRYIWGRTGGGWWVEGGGAMTMAINWKLTFKKLFRHRRLRSVAGEQNDCGGDRS